MSLLRSFFKSMRWFLVSMLLVFIIAWSLSAMNSHDLAKSAQHTLWSHSVVWFCVRLGIILAFIGLWPQYIQSMANKRNWDSEYKHRMMSRRWRYLAWFIILELAIQFL